jgi:hypothetical protein
MLCVGRAGETKATHATIRSLATISIMCCAAALLGWLMLSSSSMAGLCTALELNPGPPEATTTCRPFGMLYHDSASAGFDDHHNVMADSPGMWWLLINSGRNLSVHHNYYDASCNHSQVQGACVPNTTVGTTCQRLNLSAHIHDNVFVRTAAGFPAEAKQIMLAAGPTL